MSAVTVIMLDTTAPVVEFGSVMQLVGNRLVVEYSTNEPALIEASFLVDGDELDMAVVGDRLIMQLPVDTDALTGLVRVVATDDVWNEEVYTLPVFITGQYAEIHAVLEKAPTIKADVIKDPKLHARTFDDVAIDPKLSKATRMNVRVLNDEDLEMQ